MKRILWVTAIVAVTIFCLLGCKKDKQSVVPDNQVPKPKTYLPASISSSNLRSTYAYHDNTNYLVSVNKTVGAIVHTYGLYFSQVKIPRGLSYYVNGDLVSITNFEINEEGNVVRGDVYVSKHDWAWDSPATLDSYYTLNYNGLNKLIRVNYFKANGDKDFEESFEHLPGGNVSKITRSGNTNFEYDNLNGMGKSVVNAHLFYIQGGDYLLFYNQNNLTKVNQATRSYKYNDDKYPIEMTNTNADSTSVYTIEYFVK